MKGRRAIQLAGVVISLSLLLACGGSPSPSHLGAFVSQEGSLIEMDATTDGNIMNGDLSGVPEISDPQPLIVYWNPDFPISDLSWEVRTPSGELIREANIRFDATPKGKEGVIEIRPREELMPGVHCLVAHSFLLPPYQAPSWCFMLPADQDEAAERATTPSEIATSPASTTPIQTVEPSLAPYEVTATAVMDDRLATIYGQGLDAELAEDWLKAVRIYQEIVSVNPQFRDTQQRLSSATTELEGVYAAANAAAKTKDLETAVDLFESIAGYQDADDQARSLREQVQEATYLYEEGAVYFEQQDWEKVVEILAQVASIYPNYEDTMPRLEQALDVFYERGMTHFNRDEWEGALLNFAKINEAIPDYRDAGSYAQQSRDALVASLYELGMQHADVDEWWDAVYYLQKLLELEPQYQDAQTLLEEARSHVGEIAFASDRTGSFEVWVVQADGQKPERLTISEQVYAIHLAWSPLGDKLLYVSNYSDVYVMDRNGTNRMRLFEDENVYAVSWVPASDQIAYLKSYALWLADIDGRNRHIGVGTEWGARDYTIAQYYWTQPEGGHAWFPDGKRVVLAGQFAGERSSLGNGVAEIIFDTGEFHLLASSAGLPAVSPDGSKVAFVLNREIFVMNADGTNQLQLTENTADDTEPTWSPDGKKIAFATNRDGNYEIYVMNADGSNPVNITNDSRNDRQPAWTGRATQGSSMLTSESMVVTDTAQSEAVLTPEVTNQTTSSATQPPAPSPLILENFEDFADDAGLRTAYTVNTIDGKNVGELSISSPPHVGSGAQAAAFHYEIRNEKPDDYTGFLRWSSPQNWQPYSAFHVWVKSDGSNMDLVIQFRETSGEVWRYRTNLSRFTTKELQLPLNKATFQWADWSDWQNGQIDLHAIEYYGFFVGNGGERSGTVFFDDIELR